MSIEEGDKKKRRPRRLKDDRKRLLNEISDIKAGWAITGLVCVVLLVFAAYLYQEATFMGKAFELSEKLSSTRREALIRVTDELEKCKQEPKGSHWFKNTPEGPKGVADPVGDHGYARVRNAGLIEHNTPKENPTVTNGGEIPCGFR